MVFRKLGACWLLLALLGLAPAHAAEQVHWTIAGPTAVTFDWVGLENSIQFGLKPALGQTQQAYTPTPMPWDMGGPFKEARLTGLVADTLYYWRIGPNDPLHTFRTPRAPGRSDFVVYVEADLGSTANYWRMGVVQQQIAEGKPAFVLVPGDLTYANSQGFDRIRQHFNDVMVWSRDAAYMPTWGNHEWDGGDYDDDLRNYKGRFDLPNPSTSPGVPSASCCGEDWYWFDYGNVRFIAYPELFPGAFADWRTHAEPLMAAAQANPQITFIVTFGHRPAYSSGRHPGSPSLKQHLDELGATYSKYRLNLNGHSHNYERTYPQSGVVHVTAGGGGVHLSEEDATCLWRGGCPAPSWSAFRALHHGPVRLTFSADQIAVDAICGPPGDDETNINDITCDLGTVFDSTVIRLTTPEGSIDSPSNDVTIAPGQSVPFAASGHDPDGHLPLTYHWDFDGGAPNVQVEDPGPVSFPAAGIYDVSMTVVEAQGFADPTPATRRVTVGNVNHAPDAVIVEPAADQTITVGESILFTGSGTDPDAGSTLTYFWEFEGGAPESHMQNPGLVTFTLAGEFEVSLTVTDPLGLSDPTPAFRTITVLAPNQLPNAEFELSAQTGNAPLDVTASAIGSVDPDGTIVSYLFDFGDGTTFGPSMEDEVFHRYQAGTFTARLVVTDDRGGQRTVLLPVEVAATGPGANLVSNASAETGLTGWAGYQSATLARVPGGFDGDWAIEVRGPAVVQTFGLNDSPNWVAQVPSGRVGIPYRFEAWARSTTHAARIRLQVREFNAGIKVGETQLSPLITLTEDWRLLLLDHAAQQAGSTLDLIVLASPLVAGETFLVDNVSIRWRGEATAVEPGGSVGQLGAVAIPNPMRLAGRISFHTPREGPVRMQILDLNGRWVRTLIDEPRLAAGVHGVVFDGKDGQGRPLASGVYFYRIQAGATAETRRFAFIR